MDNDTISVRPDERFDESCLAEYLRGKLEGTEKALTVRQFGGGAANLTYLLDYGACKYVLRRPPLGPVAPSSHDMDREFKVLSVLHEAFPYAPQAFLLCADPEVIGAPFFIMDRRRGIVIRRNLPKEFSSMPEAPRYMSKALIDVLAKFHKVDYNVLGLSELGKPEGFISRQVNGWYTRWEKAKHQEMPEMDEIYAWLENNLPDSTHYSLVHNDYKLDNIMFSKNSPKEVVAVFDWDMCTLGDPLSDLGSLLSYWSEPSDPEFLRKAAMMPTENGFLFRNELLERYSEIIGRDISDIKFYHVLGLFRVVGIVAQIYIRYVRGQTEDKRFAIFGDMIPFLTQSALNLIQEP